MAYADTVPVLNKCPRCSDRAYEVFKTHAYCAACFYEQVYSDSLCVVPPWALEALASEKARKREHGPVAAPIAKLRIVAPFDVPDEGLRPPVCRDCGGQSAGGSYLPQCDRCGISRFQRGAR